ncbi:homeobox-leucine zipper family protein /lipid-binding START domain-containing protein [Striga asiatica]|uniref:Homeobox-leucine zipper family protein /lipid-binding START domain-containing protein n=1 Tax=Striga asiatica TaxID=4170 RepID=A0A5A7QQY0_STRAF|nr:homeobox-leucine zipper family protein /lipid-binding START domain-containing protein [Striga asiatica]
MSYNTDNPNCTCGLRAEIRTSWKTPNCGRRFFSCLHWPGGGCKFFGWVDPPLCARAQQIIPGLLRRLNEIEESSKSADIEKFEVLKFDEENKKLKKLNFQSEEKNKKLKKLNFEFEEENKKLKAEILKLKYESCTGFPLTNCSYMDGPGVDLCIVAIKGVWDCCVEISSITILSSS